MIKKEYVTYILTLKQALNYGLVLKKCMESLNLIQKLDLIDALIWIQNYMKMQKIDCENLFEADESSSFCKNSGKCKKKLRY